MSFILLVAAKYLIYLLFILAGFILYQKFQKGNFAGVARDSLTILVSLVVGLIITWLIRTYYPIPRPFVVDQTTPLIPHDPSPGFPSQHAVISFILVNYLFTQSKKWWWLAFGLALIITGARVYTKVHSLLDIEGGAILAIIVYFVVSRLVRFKI